MKTMTRILMCLVLAALFTATTGCDETLMDAFDDLGYYDVGTYYDDGYDSWDSGSSSGTFFSDYGGSVSWW